MSFSLRLLLAAVLIAASAIAPAQQFNARQAAIADYYISEDVSVFKSGGASIIEKLVGSIHATPQVLRNTYSENEVAGDRSYFRKTLLVTGKISRINSGIGNTPYLILQDGNDFSGTQAAFKHPDIDRIANLKRGASIQLVCVGGGSVAGTPVLRDCEFADDVAKKEASSIRRSVALAQAGETDKLGQTMWALIRITEKYLPPSSQCGIDQLKCSKEIRKIGESESFDKDVEQARQQLGL